MRVFRSDVGALKKAAKQSNGWLRADGLLTRTGVFLYLDEQGKERRELRLPDEVFRGDSLESFGLVPITNNHPPELLDANNTKEYSVGAVSEKPHRDGDYVRASLLITDARTIADMELGKRQLSCGYSCDLEATSGDYNGEKYDAIQRNIRGNHVAIVDVARAGPEARVRLDGVHVGAPVDLMLGSTTTPADTTAAIEDQLMKIRIDGVEYEVTEQVAQAIDKERASAKAASEALAARADASDKAKDKIEAERDALKAEADKANAAHADAADPVKFTAAVAARVALEVQARKFLGADAKLDGVSARDVHAQVLAKVDPNVKLDGKSDDYVAHRFEFAVDHADKASDALGTARAAATNAGHTDSATDEVAARKRMIDHNQNAWKRDKAGA